MKLNLFKPDCIINCAADQNPNDNNKAITELLNSNLKANILFLNQAIKNKNFVGYISFGSKWEYNQHGEFNPLNFYAVQNMQMIYFKILFIKKRYFNCVT